MKQDLHAARNLDGKYVVLAPWRVRDPIDWLAVVWVVVGIIGLAMPIVSVACWLMGW